MLRWKISLFWSIYFFFLIFITIIDFIPTTESTKYAKSKWCSKFSSAIMNSKLTYELTISIFAYVILHKDTIQSFREWMLQRMITCRCTIRNSFFFIQFWQILQQLQGMVQESDKSWITKNEVKVRMTHDNMSRVKMKQQTYSNWKF